MKSIATDGQHRWSLSTALATRGEKRVALAIIVVSTLLFAVCVPFVRVPLARMPAFIPAYQSALFLVDLITALLLFDQFARTRSRAMLILASAYLFDALIIVAHTLSFPGAFAPAGLVTGGEQTTAWLYIFWHGGFPLFVIAYALLQRREVRDAGVPVSRAGVAVAWAVAAVVLVTGALTLLATAGHDWLPVVMQGNNYAMLVSKGISPAVWILTLVAIGVLWRREMRVIDLWLMVVMWVWLLDIALAAVIGSSRFDLGFYAGRMFGLVAASFLLVTLLVEMARLYSGALGAAASAEQNLARMVQSQRRAGLKPRRDESTEDFVQRQNVEHFQALLESGTLDGAERQRIEKLLAELQEEPAREQDR